MNNHNLGDDISDDIVIDDTPSEALDQRVTLLMTASAVGQLETAAFCAGITPGELFMRLLRNHLNETGL